jgi:hypothetical protein
MPGVLSIAFVRRLAMLGLVAVALVFAGVGGSRGRNGERSGASRE